MHRSVDALSRPQALARAAPDTQSSEERMHQLLANASGIYGAAFETYQRAVVIESRDRAELLAALWRHASALAELRAATVIQRSNVAAHGRVRAADAAASESAADAARAREELREQREEHAREVELRDAQLEAIAQARPAPCVLRLKAASFTR